MTSKSITEKRDDEPSRGGWRPAREMAPSVVRDDEPKVARLMGLWGLMIAVLGAAIIVLTTAGFRGLFGAGWGILFLALGIIMMLFHAVSDRDQQVRRAYGALGGVGLFLVGAILPWVPYGEGTLFGLGYPFLCLAFMFALAFLRHEDEEPVRGYAVTGIGAAGGLLAGIGILGGFINEDFLVPRGALLALLGLAYLCAFVSVRGSESDVGYRAALGMGGLGAIVFLVAAAGSFIPGWLPFVPAGILLMLLGLLYVFGALLLASDNALVVMLRHELAAYFFSPIAYLVLIGMSLCAWASFVPFVWSLAMGAQPGRSGMMEPIVREYFGVLPVICMIFFVPVITMRLVSEEWRTGTLEVALTAPVRESTIVLSKFIAGLLFFLLSWLPWALLLVALRVISHKEFDYRPLFSFYIVLLIFGAGFVSMGLFFSSLTRNQIVSAVLTFAAMLLATVMTFLKDLVGNLGTQPGQEHPLSVVFRHMSYLETWWEALDGKLVPKYLLFHLSLAILFVFLSIKVIEARKWS